MRTVILAPTVLVPGAAAAAVTGTAHDFSSAWTDRTCDFCHTPHLGNTGLEMPMWNRVIGEKTYTMYSSASLDAASSASPDDYSLVCMGCHDGVLATGSFGGYDISDKHSLINGPGGGEIPDGSSYPACYGCHKDIYGDPPTQFLGTDLSDDHPISVSYPTPAEDPDFNSPPDAQDGWWTSAADNVKLYSGKVQCPSCHNPHGTDYEPFLRVSNEGSDMCLVCHIK